MRKYLKKEREKRGEKRKKLAPFWKVMSFFPLVSNTWMIPYITIRRPAVAAITAAMTAAGRKKRNRNRKEKKIAVAVQHSCQLRVDLPGPPSA